jgi:hypothetical protein
MTLLLIGRFVVLLLLAAVAAGLFWAAATGRE